VLSLAICKREGARRLPYKKKRKDENKKRKREKKSFPEIDHAAGGSTFYLLTGERGGGKNQEM